MALFGSLQKEFESKPWYYISVMISKYAKFIVHSCDKKNFHGHGFNKFYFGFFRRFRWFIFLCPKEQLKLMKASLGT